MNCPVTNKECISSACNHIRGEGDCAHRSLIKNNVKVLTCPISNDICDNLLCLENTTCQGHVKPITHLKFTGCVKKWFFVRYDGPMECIEYLNTLASEQVFADCIKIDKGLVYYYNGVELF